MLSPLAVGLGFGKWGGSASSSSSPSEPSAAGPSRSGKGKEADADAGAGTHAPVPGPQSFWNKTSTLYGLGAVALGAAAAGTAYYRREDFMNGWKWGFDHMTFVRNLWDDSGMKERLDALDRLGRDRDIMFNKYVRIPSPRCSLRLVTSSTVTDNRS